MGLWRGKSEVFPGTGKAKEGSTSGRPFGKEAADTESPHGNGKSRPTRVLDRTTEKLFLVVSEKNQAGVDMQIVTEYSLCAWQSARHFSMYYCFEIKRLPKLSASRRLDESSFGERGFMYG